MQRKRPRIAATLMSVGAIAGLGLVLAPAASAAPALADISGTVTADGGCLLTYGELGNPYTREACIPDGTQVHISQTDSNGPEEYGHAGKTTCWDYIDYVPGQPSYHGWASDGFIHTGSDTCK